MIKNVMLAAVFAGAIAGVAQAATVTTSFDFKDGSSTTVAFGSFSYDSSSVGLLSYSDLASFSVTLVVDAITYTLANVNALSDAPGAAYKYFGYDTTTNNFEPFPANGPVGPYNGILAATDLTTGFFFDPLTSQSGPYNDGYFAAYPGNVNRYAETVSFSSVSGVPLPAGLPLILVGLGALGAVGAGRKSKKKAA